MHAIGAGSEFSFISSLMQANLGAEVSVCSAKRGGVVQKMSAPDKLGWSFSDVGARADPSPQRPFHTSVASGRLEKGDEGGDLD